MADLYLHLFGKHLHDGGDLKMERGQLVFVAPDEVVETTDGAVVTGDPLVDRWERLLAQGIDPFAAENAEA